MYSPPRPAIWLAFLAVAAIPTVWGVPAVGQSIDPSGRPTTELGADALNPPQTPEAGIGNEDTALIAPGNGEPMALEQGPIHEAFAAPVGSNVATAEESQPAGSVVNEQPPEPVNEIPPDEQPEGANVQWIPGYWMWAQDREGFVWVSGVWREVPPGHEWAPGSWVEVDGGYAWSPGFWVESGARQVTYLPPPPQSLEQGPSSPRPADNYFWAPGCWVYQQQNYSWRPGFWTVSQPNWVWVPSYYNRTPRGYVHVNGYWDRPLARRGVLYAPVYWRGNGFNRPGYAYRPRSVIDAGLLITSLFVNPGRNHYYYGSYGPQYRNQGYFPWLSYASGPRHYDPLYSYYRTRNLGGRNGWSFNDLARQYRGFDNPNRDQRADRDQRPNGRRGPDGRRGNDLLVSSYADLAGREGARRMKPVDRQVDEQLNNRVERMREFSRERAALETEGALARRNQATRPGPDRNAAPGNADAANRPGRGSLDLDALTAGRRGAPSPARRGGSGELNPDGQRRQVLRPQVDDANRQGANAQQAIQQAQERAQRARQRGTGPNTQQRAPQQQQPGAAASDAQSRADAARLRGQNLRDQALGNSGARGTQFNPRSPNRGSASPNGAAPRQLNAPRQTLPSRPTAPSVRGAYSPSPRGNFSAPNRSPAPQINRQPTPSPQRSAPSPSVGRGGGGRAPSPAAPSGNGGRGRNFGAMQKK